MALIFRASWSDFEEYASISIYENLGRYYAHESGHCVMADFNAPEKTRREVSEDEVYSLMEDWSEHEELTV